MLLQCEGFQISLFDLSFFLNQLGNVDLVMVEGYKNGLHKKIEVFDRKLGKQPIFLEDDTICAVAYAGQRLNTSLPVFDRNEIEAIAEFIIKFFKIKI